MRCPVSAALKTAHWIFFLFYILILIHFFPMKPLSEVAPGLLVIQIQIQAVWAVMLNSKLIERVDLN